MILDDIVQEKRDSLAREQKIRPLSVLAGETARLPKRRPAFVAALEQAAPPAVIAEIKKKSPSKGILRDHFDPAAIAKAYERAGAAAISVLTDGPFFGGSAADLRAVKQSVALPVLRKDFIISEYQVHETRLMGADAFLLIAAILERQDIENLRRLGEGLGLDCLIEIHDQADAEKVLPLKPKLLGINNRDLRTFDVDITTTAALIKRFLPNSLVVSESGIQINRDLLYLKGLGVRAALVGESLMTAPDIESALRALLGGSGGPR